MPQQLAIMRHASMVAGAIKWSMGIRNFFKSAADKAFDTRTSDYKQNLVQAFLDTDPANAGKLSTVDAAITVEARGMAKNSGQQSSISANLGIPTLGKGK